MPINYSFAENDDAEDFQVEENIVQDNDEVFDEDDVRLILDLSMYIVFSGSAIFQHFPIWARKHVLFSNTIRSDSFISRFLGKKLEYSKIRLFCHKWASKHIGSWLVYCAMILQIQTSFAALGTILIPPLESSHKWRMFLQNHW